MVNQITDIPLNIMTNNNFISGPFDHTLGSRIVVSNTFVVGT